MKVEILQAIWQRSYTGANLGHLPYLALIDRRTNKFSERTWTFGPDLATHTIQYEMQDLFFSPLIFDGPRKNDKAFLPGVLFADLDRMHPEALSDVAQPSVLWETSPGNYQAVWFLAKAPPNAVRWVDVNRRLTYATQADRGGWHASKLLRVPETRNFKYPEAPLGKVVSFNGHEVSFSGFDHELPPVPGIAMIPDSHPRPPEHTAWKIYVKQYWQALSLEQRSMIAAPRVLDRSSQIVWLSNSLKRSGFDPTARFILIWGVEWNKWRTDRYNPEYLWKVVNS